MFEKQDMATATKTNMQEHVDIQVDYRLLNEMEQIEQICLMLAIYGGRIPVYRIMKASSKLKKYI